MSIKIENLSFKYKNSRQNVLDNINLVINDGELVVLLGNNGCGKTTLIHNIEGFIYPSSGSVSCNEKDLFKMTTLEHSKLIAYVSQTVSKLEDILIKDYLSFGFTNNLKFYQKPSKRQMELVELYANKLNITHLLDKKIDEISGGERQIVSICCALLQDTKVILLDEPTSALDIKNQHMVLSVLKEIAKEQNKTIILSSHNPNHALFLNSKVALMKYGKIINYGDAIDIINPTILSEIYGEDVCYSDELKYREVSFK